MADIREEINSSSDSETCIDEIKAEDYNFYVLNNILSQNIILQNYLNEEGIVNSLQQIFMNFTAPSDPSDILSDSKQMKTDVSLISTAPLDLENKSIKNEFQGQSPRVTLKDTFLEDVLSTSTKSFIERVSKGRINKKTLRKTPSHCVYKDNRSALSKGSPSRTPQSLSVAVDTDLKNSSSSRTLALDDRYSDTTDTSPSTVTLGTRIYSEEEKKQIGSLIGTDESRTVPQKRKEKCYSKSTPYNVQKKVKLFSTCHISSSQDMIKNDSCQELNCTTDTHATIIRNEPKSVCSVAIHQTDDKSQPSGEYVRGNMMSEAQTFISSKSNTNKSTVASDIPSDDFEWSIENLQLFGLALPEDSDMDSITAMTENSNSGFSCIETCPYGCRDLMSSEHLNHLRLAALKLSQKETNTSESFAESENFKNETMSLIKNKLLVEKKGNSRSNEYQKNENAQEKNIKIISDAGGSKPLDVLINVTDSKDSSSKIVLNGTRRDMILNSNLKLCDQVTCQYCENSQRHIHGRPPVPVHCIRNPGNTSGVPQSLSCSNLTLSGTSVPQGPNNNIAAHNIPLANSSYNIAAASASSNFYKPSGMYGFGNMNNENYIQLEPFTVPNGSMWFGKQAQTLNNPFNTTNMSPHVMNSPWYQQWFHAMNMRRPLASQLPSTPCNYFEPLKMNHYRKTFWGTPSVGQQRMYQRTNSTMGSLPRMFQTPFLHSCFPATISSGSGNTATHVQYAGQQTEIPMASHSPVSMEVSQQSNVEESGKS